MYSTNSLISFEEDGFIVDRIEEQARWIATLSDGRLVYSDDDRPEVLPPSAWTRVKNFCEENGLYVKSLTLQFRSHREVAVSDEDGVDGIFLRRSVLCSMNGGRNLHSYVVGKIKNGKCIAVKWRTPELIVDEIEERDIFSIVDSCIFQPGVLECLISQRDRNSINLQQLETTVPHLST